MTHDWQILCMRATYRDCFVFRRKLSGGDSTASPIVNYAAWLGVARP